jgi:hypothetical protein
MGVTERMATELAARPRVARAKRPKLTAEDVVEYLDWVMDNVGTFAVGEADMHMKAAELAIRTRATDAQAKDTQHTLVRDGVIDAPTL